MRSLALRVVVSLLCAVAVAAMLAPGAGGASTGMGVVGWMVRAAGFGACLLALAVAWLQPGHAASAPLALLLSLGSFGAGLIRLTTHPAWLATAGVPRRVAATVGVAALVLAAAALARTSVTFPRPFARDDLRRRLDDWRAPEKRRRYVGALRIYRRIDNAFIRFLLRGFPRGRRREAGRSFLQQRRQMLLSGKPQMPTSWLGLPWTGWRVGAAAAAVTVGCLAAGWAAAGLAAALIAAVVMGSHALVYFTVGFQLGDATAKRQTLWVFAGSMGVFVLMALAGLLQGVLWAVGFGADRLGRAPAAEPAWADAWPVISGGALALAALGMVVATAVAIFRHGALDPRLVIRSTALYGSLGAVLGALFIVLENVASTLLESTLRLPLGAGSWVAGAAVALGFGPVRSAVLRRTNALVDRLIPATALAEGTRRQAAIVFCDLVGYTALTAEDQTRALTTASLLHKQARAVTREVGGRVVKNIGDAVLLEFETVALALEGIGRLHRQYRSACEVLDLERTPLQSGMHWGEVVVARDQDVYGEAVNLAARLQGAAAPDALVLSGEAAARLPEPDRRRLEALGAREFRNVAAEVECYRCTFSVVEA